MKDIPFNDRINSANIPALSNKSSHRDVDGEQMKTEWEYACIIRQLNLFVKQPDLT